METILGFFLLWPVMIVMGILVSIAYIVATEHDVHGFSIFATIVAALIYLKPILAFVAVSWQFILLGILIYCLLGAIWSVFRWFKYCRKYVEEHPAHSLSDHDMCKWEGGNTSKMSLEEYYLYKLQPSKHKSQLIGWVVYWPWSLLWNIIGDFLTGIYDALANIYKKTADVVVKKALKP